MGVSLPNKEGEIKMGRRKKVEVNSYHVMPIICSDLFKSKCTTNIISHVPKEKISEFTKDIKSVEYVGGDM